jgi:hypothetical protein
VVDVGQPSLHTQAQVVTDHLGVLIGIMCVGGGGMGWGVGGVGTGMHVCKCL